MKLSLCNIIFFIGVSASADSFMATPEYFVLNQPYKITRKINSEKNERPNLDCDQLRYNYISELAVYNNLIFEVKKLNEVNPKSEAQIKKLRDFRLQLEEVAEKLNFLAKPEWNSELYEVELVWFLNQKLIFEESDYENLKEKIKLEGFLSLSDEERERYRRGHPFRNKGFILDRISYAGAFRPDFIEYFNKGDSKITSERGYHFSVKKRATLLELCQFVKTIKIDFHLNIESQALFPLIYTSEFKVILSGGLL